MLLFQKLEFSYTLIEFFLLVGKLKMQFSKNQSQF